MTKFEAGYLELVQHVKESGDNRTTRNGPTRQIFGTTLATSCMRQNKFPILTSRKIYYKAVLGELAAFLRGATDLQTFRDFGCNYWDANALKWERNRGKELLAVGNIYGNKWRDWPTGDIDDGETIYLDQIKKLVQGLKEDPNSRRHLLTTYDPAETWQCLPPCHLMAQFNVDNDGFLDCIVYMRSVDLCLGLPSDVILYATLMILIAKETGYRAGDLTFMLADTHIYENHVEEFQKQYDAKTHELPTWRLDASATLDNFEPRHLDLIDYQHEEKRDYKFSV